MLARRRSAGAAARRRASAFAARRRTTSPFADRRFDVTVSVLRVLMHTPDWRAYARASCAASRRPGSSSTIRRGSASRRSSRAARRVLHAAGRSTEPYRVFGDGAIDAVLPRRRLPRDRDRHRQFVLPIALHKAVGSRAAARDSSEGALRASGVTALVGSPGHVVAEREACAGAIAARRVPRDRRDRVHRRTSGAARSPRDGARGPCAGPQSARGRRPGRCPASSWSTGDLTDAGVARAAPSSRRRRRLQHRRAVSRSRACRQRLPRRSTPTAVGRIDRRRRARRRARASSTAAPSACTATSSTRRPTKTRRSRPATSIRSRSSKASGSRAARARRTGVELVIARPSGIYGPGDRRLLKLFRGVARRRFVVLGDGEIFYHLTYIDDLVEGVPAVRTHPAAAGRTYILAGRRSRR